ncbi:Uncharacterized protein AXF42_Ash020406 [Apostasia shenzhenica]|uniref:Pentatricopeptide repeat-containing protein n=1 Tax=Apostasia shenzhenica TaxID=1088818 RepID=A0A2I0AAB2_9ASPA|nr:Uncharacterized protein AXF42_Ash020406 [Apostasia shenzhenica]
MMTTDFALAMASHASRFRLSSNGAASSSWSRGSDKLSCVIRNGLRLNVGCCSRLRASKSWRRETCACAKSGHSESIPDPRNSSMMQKYHPSEEISESFPVGNVEEVRLSDAEIARTLIEVNNKASLMFTEEIGAVRHNAICPDVSYLTDEHGDIYFEVTDDDVVKQFISDDADDRLVHVIIGLDNIEILTEIEAFGPSEFDFGLEVASSEDDEIDDDSEEDEEIIFEEEEEDDDYATSKILNDWSHPETMHATHPFYFAHKIAEVVSNINMDLMDQPSANVVIQGLLRSAFMEEHKFNKMNLPVSDTGACKGKHLEESNEHNMEEELDKFQSMHNETTFYKLEILNIQLVSAYGSQSTVKVQDFHRARPDIIAHSAANILSRLKAGGEKTTQALKAFCWKCKGIQVEEASIIGLDSLGFDLRVCSGTQIQTLRISFKTRATSEFSAEKQVHELLFPRLQQRKQRQAAQSKEY